MPVLTALPFQAPGLGAGWSAPSVSRSSSAAASTTVGSSSLTSGGSTGTVTMTGVVLKDKNGKPDASQATMEMGLKIDSPSDGSVSVAVTLGLGDDIKTTGPCPDSAGRIDMSSKSAFSFRTAEEGTSLGLDYIRKNTSIKMDSTFVAQVSPDAFLETVTFSVAVTGVVAYAASGFNGLLKRNHVITINARATGTVNGRTGAVSVASLQLDGKGKALGMSDRDAQAAVREGLAGDKIYGEIAARLAADAYERLKAAEKIWRQPNRCVDMKFAPPSGAKLAAGATQGVDGKIVAMRDGKPTTALWKAPKLTLGSLVGAWAGTSTPTKALHFVAKGAARNAAGQTFALTTTATSRAGIASGPWVGRTGGFPLQFVGSWTRTVTSPSRGSWIQIVQGLATYTRSPSSGDGSSGPVEYALTSNTVTWSVSGSQTLPGGTTCAFSGSGPDSPAANVLSRLTLEDVSRAQGAPSPEAMPFYYSIWDLGDESRRPSYQIDCGGGPYADDVLLPYLQVGFPAWRSNPTEIMKSAAVALLKGNRSRTTSNGDVIAESWSFLGSIP